jgi:VWFA-related protein
MRTRSIGVLCALTVAVNAQQPPVIQTNVPLVLVPVTVTDKKGDFIDGLSVENFSLTDDGVRQDVRMDTSDAVLAPMSLVVAVQCTGISSAVLGKIDRVGGMIQPLITGNRGRAAVLAFDDEIRVFQDFTGNSENIREAFAEIKARSTRGARMLDATVEAVRMLETRPENSRRVLLLLSESRDRGSKNKLPRVIEIAQRADVTVYSATYSVYATPWTAKPEENPPPLTTGPVDGIVDLFRLGKTNTTEAFARATGGQHLSFETLLGLENAITRAGAELHSQYLLSFVPRESNNEGFHRIAVAVTSRPDAVIRARPGYWPKWR